MASDMFWVNVYLAGFLFCLVIYSCAEPFGTALGRALRWPLLMVAAIWLLFSWLIAEIHWRWFSRRRFF